MSDTMATPPGADNRNGIDRVSRSDAWRRAFIQANRRRCHYCNRKGSLDVGPDDRPWHVDHMTAIARGGTDEDENLALACKRCNLAKGVQPYQQFRTFARAAFWVPDDWRASEADLDMLMEYFAQVADSYDPRRPWQVDHLNDKIVLIGEDGPGSPEVVLELGDALSHRKHRRTVLFLVEEMHRLLPALVAEIRMARADVHTALAEAQRHADGRLPSNATPGRDPDSAPTQEIER